MPITWAMKAFRARGFGLLTLRASKLEPAVVGAVLGAARSGARWSAKNRLIIMTTSACRHVEGRGWKVKIVQSIKRKWYLRK